MLRITTNHRDAASRARLMTGRSKPSAIERHVAAIRAAPLRRPLANPGSSVSADVWVHGGC